MLCEAREEHAEHDRGDVSDMFSGGGESDDRKDSAEGRSVQFAADAEDKDRCKEAVDGHVEYRCSAAVVPEIIGSADSGAGKDLSVGCTDLLSAKKKCRDDHGDEEAAEDRKQQLVVALRPDQAGFGGDAEGF